MKKLCGLVVASVMILGLGSGPAAAASATSAELNRGGMICWLFPSRCK